MVYLTYYDVLIKYIPNCITLNVIIDARWASIHLIAILMKVVLTNYHAVCSPNINYNVKFY